MGRWQTRSLLGRLGPVVVFSAAFLLIWLINYRVGIGLMGDMADRDFTHLATGVKGLVSGRDPYDPETWPHLRRSFGGTVVQDPSCNYPLWTLILFAPLALLPFRLGVSLWTTVSEFALVISVGLLAVVTNSQRRRSWVFPAALGALMFRPFIVSLTSGQMSPLLLLILAAALFAHLRGQSLLAGFLLGLLIAKPHLMVLFVPAVGLLFLARREWRALAGLTMSILLLVAGSWLVRPGWLWNWLGTTRKATVAPGTPTLWGLAFEIAGPEHWVAAGTVAAALVSALTLFLVVQRAEDLGLGIGVALCGSLLVAPYLWNYDQLLLLVPGLIAFGRSRGRRWLRVAGWLSVVWVVPWGLFLVANHRAFDTLSVFVTFAVAIYLCASSWRIEGTGETPS